ncbi:MAG: hypothetical protein NTV34_21705 [Proteobacteria bacterium]|nr:hypothetical protein [Pseudomonadota bacterium]
MLSLGERSRRVSRKMVEFLIAGHGVGIETLVVQQGLRKAVLNSGA